jgi:predicted RNase H-like nuclease
MGDMDTTRIDELLTELETSDPAHAPDVADELTAALADQLDGAGSIDSESPAEPAADPDGGAH